MRHWESWQLKLFRMRLLWSSGPRGRPLVAGVVEYNARAKTACLLECRLAVVVVMVMMVMMVIWASVETGMAVGRGHALLERRGRRPRVLMLSLLRRTERSCASLVKP